MQIQQRQHLRDLRRLPGPRRQDHRSEPATLTGRLVGALVVDPWCPHRDRSRSRGDLPGPVVAVADHQPVAGLVDLVDVGVDIGGASIPATPPPASPGRRHGPGYVEHLTRRPPQACRRWARTLLWTTLSMGVPSTNQRALTPVLIETFGLQIILKVRSFVFYPAEGHPQVLIIALSSRATRL